MSKPLTTAQVEDGFAHDEWDVNELEEEMPRRESFRRWFSAELAAAEKRGAVKALRDARDMSRSCWSAGKNLLDPGDPDVAYSFDVWLGVLADRLEEEGTKLAGGTR